MSKERRIIFTGYTLKDLQTLYPLKKLKKGTIEVETWFILISPNIADVDKWNNIIGLSPSEYVIKGNKVSANPRSMISDTSYWSFEIERCLEKTVEDQILRMLDQVYLKKIEILKLVKEQGLSVKFKTFVWSDHISDLSIQFSNDLLRRMTGLEISFSLERY